MTTDLDIRQRGVDILAAIFADAFDLPQCAEAGIAKALRGSDPVPTYYADDKGVCIAGVEGVAVSINLRELAESSEAVTEVLMFDASDASVGLTIDDETIYNAQTALATYADASEWVYKE